MFEAIDAYLLVFSTYVEVILDWSILGAVFASILHVCGGDPIPPIRLRASKSCILHVCGGDPYRLANCNDSSKYSPRMWR